MHLKPFEAGRYNDGTIVVSNPQNYRQELFTEREYAIVKFLKQNENQSLLALLMPNIGIAKKSHIEMCLRVLSKLKRIQIVDYFSITGRVASSGTKSLEVSMNKATIEFASLNALAVTIEGIGGKILGKLGYAGLLGLNVALAAISFAFFPFASLEESLKVSSPPYLALLLLIYVAGSLAFSFRSIVQAGFLRSFGRELINPVFGLRFSFLSLIGDSRLVNLYGFKPRAQLAVLGLIAPVALSAIFTLLTLAQVISPLVGFVALASCVLVSLLLACPLLQFDGADLLHVLFFRDSLEETVSTLLKEIYGCKVFPGRNLLISLLVTGFWLILWLYSLQSVREILSERLAEDFSSGTGSAKVGAALLVLLLVLLLFMPIFIFVIHHFFGRNQKSRKRIVVQQDKLKNSLTFEERIAALEKIPLFAYLNDQERLSLLNEMQPAFYKHGDFLMHQGELGKEFFVLVKGHCSAYYTDVHDRSMLLAELVEGDAFGEIALIDDVPRTASIVSDGGCIALVLRKEGFDRFAESLGSADRVKALVRLTSFFRRHPLFSKLSPRDQAQLIDTFRFETITAGEQIPASDENFHVVYSGAVRVDTGGGDGETTLHSDDCFGYSNPLNARYVAVEGTGLLTVPKDQFHNLIWEKLVEKPELFM